MDMPRKKRNHFVGKGIIRFWANQQGQVMYWEKGLTGKLQPRNPVSVHQAEFLYANWSVDGKRDMHAEDALAVEIDNYAPRCVQSILDNYPNIVPVPAEQRAFLARMVLRTIIRNPAVLNHLSTMPLGRLIGSLYALKRLLRRGRQTDLAYEMRGKDRVLAGEMISRLVTMDIEDRVQELSSKRFAFIVPDNDAPNFVLGSQPYFINPKMLSEGRLKGNEVQEDAFCGIVIHPRILLALYDDNNEDQIICASLEDVQRINGLFVKHSSAIVLLSSADLEGAWYWPNGREGTSDIHRIVIEIVQ